MRFPLHRVRGSKLRRERATNDLEYRAALGETEKFCHIDSTLCIDLTAPPGATRPAFVSERLLFRPVRHVKLRFRFCLARLS